MFAGKLAYLNKAHIDIKGKTAEGRQNLIRKARRAVAKEFGDRCACTYGEVRIGMLME